MEVFKIKRNDTVPALAVTLQLANGSPIDLTGGSVWFNMGNLNNYTPYISGLCVITDSGLGLCEYRWSGTSTGSVGKYWGEFEMQNLSVGSRFTLPTDHSLKIEIYEDYN